MKRCEAGLHYYDETRNDSCPYCREQAQGLSAQSKGLGGSSASSFGGDGFDQPTETIGAASQPGHSPFYGDESTDAMMGETQSIGLEGGEWSTRPLAGDTTSFIRSKGLEPDAATIGVFKKKRQFSPVVAWLACVVGPERGKSYIVKPGVNIVGRADNMHIVIKGDDTISRVDHAEIEYDADANLFYLVRRRNAEVKVNGQRVREPEELKPFDTIQFGDSLFIFVPLCSEKFKWSDQNASSSQPSS